MAARLEIKRSIAPGNLWHWMVVFDNRHIFATSKKSSQSAETCLMIASSEGIDALHAAERAEKGRAGDTPAAAHFGAAPVDVYAIDVRG